MTDKSGFRDEVALVTGATSGIGRAVALALAGAGYRVLALGRNRAALEALGAVAGIETLALDLGQPGALMALEGRRIDVLVANAGMMPKPAPFDAQSEAEIEATVLVNLTSVLRLTRAVLPQMRGRKGGHILLMGSSAAHAPGANFAVYAATKAALSAFATGLRGDVAADGIRVTELAPGRVETALYGAVLDDAARAAMYRGGTALQPQDLAEAVLAVLSMPARAAVTRLDILPTLPQPPIPLK